jgi:hypothetical protein
MNRRTLYRRRCPHRARLSVELLEDRALPSATLVAAYGFNEGSGITVADASGNNNTGTISNATWATNGKYGNALSFNGTNSWVTINDSQSLDLTNGMTLEAWVNPSNLSSWRAVLLKERPTSGLCYSLYATDPDQSNSPPSTFVNTGGSDQSTFGAAGLPLNQWTQLAATYDGSTLSLYVNGSLADSNPVSGNILVSNGALRIGGDSIWGEYFTGLIDEVRVYNGALTQTQIQSDMNTPISAAAVTVSITSPVNNATVSGTIGVTATSSAAAGVAGVQFMLDGANLGSEVTAAPYTIQWDTTSATSGSHTLTAKAIDTAGNTAVSSPVTVTVANSINLAETGQWSSVISTPANPVTGDAVVPMHMVLLNNGKILFWDGGPNCLGAVSPTIYDPVAGTFTAVPLENQTEVRDIFCSAPTVLADGRVLVAGGHDCTNPSFVGTAIANAFDPTTNQWTFLPDMNDRRWYPTATTLPDGRALVTAGASTNVTAYDPIPEVCDPVTNTWTKLTNANQTIPDYPFMFVLPDGRVLAAGSDESLMATYALNVATQTWTTIDSTVLDAGSAVQYLPGKIMKAGSSYLSPPADNGGGIPSKATTYVLDMTQSKPAWKQTASMANPRTHLNLTILPDDTVLATGGSTDIGGVNPANAVYPAELWSPTTQTWTTMASMATPRLYHSTALLLPDGRVMAAGGGHNYFNNIAYPNFEIYSPGYLFKGARPTITSSPTAVIYGSNFFIGTPDGASIQSVALIRAGAVTHSFNMDQTYVPLSFAQASGGLTVQAPANANLAPPGYYMLFMVNSNGVPSIAPLVHVPVASSDTTPPTAPTNLTATVNGSSVSLAWTASTDTVGVTGYTVYRSTVSGFTPSAANQIGTTATTSFTDSPAAGTYYYVVTAQDAAGNSSAPSNQASATVSSADTTPPTAPTNLAATGAVGSVSLTWTASTDNVGVTGYHAYRSTVSGFTPSASNQIGTSTTTSYTDTIAAGTYYYLVTAQDAAGNSSTPSNQATGTSLAAGNGLVASYAFDEGSGATTKDGSGNNNTGTITNATWTTAGKFGDALSFNGTNSWVTVNDSASLHLAKGMTLEAWVKPSGLGSWRSVLLKERPSGLSYSLYATDPDHSPSAPSTFINTGGSDQSAWGTAALSTTAWTFISATYDGSNLRMYVGGALVRTTAVTGNILETSNALRIGGDSVWGEYFNGLIDNVRIYNRALSQSEIQNDMNTAITAPAAPLVKTASMVIGTTSPVQNTSTSQTSPSILAANSLSPTASGSTPVNSAGLTTGSAATTSASTNSVPVTGSGQTQNPTKQASMLSGAVADAGGSDGGSASDSALAADDGFIERSDAFNERP